MHERESFGEMVKISISMFKADAERNMDHMFEVSHLSEPPFKRQ